MVWGQFLHFLPSCKAGVPDAYLTYYFFLCVEIRVYSEPQLWPNVEDPALDHPMSARLLQMMEIYRKLYQQTGKQQPLIKNARYVHTNALNYPYRKPLAGLN